MPKQKAIKKGKSKESDGFSSSPELGFKSKSVFGAVILVSLGTILLLNNLNLLPWRVWRTIFRLWPLILVFGGLEMIMGGSWLNKIFMALFGLLIAFLLMAGIFFWFLPVSLKNLKVDFNNQAQKFQLKTSQITISPEDYPGITKRNVSIKSGMAQISIDALSRQQLFDLQSEYYYGFIQPEVEIDRQDKTLNISLENVTKIRPFFWTKDKKISQTLSLGQKDLPTDLKLDVGVGKIEADFQEINLVNLNTQVGAGSAKFEFSANAIPQNFKIDIGAGSLTLIIPVDVGFAIDYQIGLGSLQVESQSFKKTGRFQSDNFNQADKKMIISANIGLGSLKIERK